MSERKNILRKAVEKVKEPFNDYERSLELIDKHNLPTAYGTLGSDFVHGAASHHDEKINLKHAYTPNTVLKRSLQRAALGALVGAGLSYAAHSDPDVPVVLRDTGAAAGIGALTGATFGPALAYGVGKLIEKTRLKTKKKIKQNLKG